MQRISEAEMELMQVIWNNKNPLTSREVMELLPNNPWKPTTILTMLSRLIEKGFLHAEKHGRQHLYSYLVSESEYRKGCGRDFLKKFYKGSAKNFFAALFDDGELSAEELAELRELLRQKGE